MATSLVFDRQFDHTGEVVRAGEVTPFEFPALERPGEPDAATAAPPSTCSEAELHARLADARAEAAAETEARVRAEVEAGTAGRQAAALEHIAHALGAHQAAFDRWIAERAAASRDVALALARALVPRALEHQPLADIEAMLHDLLVRLEGQPRLTLALPPAVVEAGRQLLADAAARAGYRGELLVEPDRALGAGDARLSWQGGSAERDLAALEREAIGLIDAWLPETTARPWPTDPPDPSTDAAMS